MKLRIVKDDEVPEADPEKMKVPLKDYLTFAGASAIMVLFFSILIWLALSANGYL